MAHRFEGFSVSPTGFRVQLRRRARIMGAVFALGAVTLGGIAPVISSTDYEPIDIAVEQPVIVPGETLPVRVELSGAGSASVTLYSDPPGAVSYQGMLQSGNTVLATTNSSLQPSTSVTVYAITDGVSVVQTRTSVKTAADSPPNQFPNWVSNK